MRKAEEVAKKLSENELKVKEEDKNNEEVVLKPETPVKKQPLNAAERMALAEEKRRKRAEADAKKTPATKTPVEEEQPIKKEIVLEITTPEIIPIIAELFVDSDLTPLHPDDTHE